MTEYVDADVVGVGFGPANIALAIAFEELHPELSAVFLERAGGPAWQPGMMLDGSDIQHHPARDLVTPRNPRSRYTFLNYLVEDGRLFEFLNLGLPFPLRKDYARYVAWAAEQFSRQVRYGTEVSRVGADVGPDGRPRAVVELADGRRVRGRAAIVAPGRAPLIPAVFAGLDDPRIFHFTRYLDRVAGLGRLRSPRLAIVGGSQSAVELMLDAWRRFGAAEIVGIMRGFGYRQKDLSPFTGEVYFPSFVDYYYDAPELSKRDLDRQLRFTNYSSADADVLQQLNARLYEHRLDGENRVRLARNVDITRCTPGPGGVDLELLDRHSGIRSVVTVDAVVLATGFLDLTAEHEAQFLPDVLAPLADRVARTPARRARVGRDYRLAGRPGAPMPPLYLNGLCETTHGMGDAGSFSLLSLRAAAIADSVAAALTATAAGDPRGAAVVEEVSA